jgi:hypothetical protein
LYSRKHDGEVQLYAFDILALDGGDLRKLPSSVRKTNLARLLAGRPDRRPSNRARLAPICFGPPAEWASRGWCRSIEPSLRTSGNSPSFWCDHHRLHRSAFAQVPLSQGHRKQLSASGAADGRPPHQQPRPRRCPPSSTSAKKIGQQRTSQTVTSALEGGGI